MISQLQNIRYSRTSGMNRTTCIIDCILCTSGWLYLFVYSMQKKLYFFNHLIHYCSFMPATSYELHQYHLLLLVLFSYRDSALLWNCFAISLLKHDIICCCSLLLLHRLECSYEPYLIRSNQAWTPQIRRSLNETVYAWITRIRLHYWYIVDRYSGIYDYVRCISRRCQVIIWQMTSFFCRRVEHAQDMRYIIMD